MEGCSGTSHGFLEHSRFILKGVESSRSFSCIFVVAIVSSLKTGRDNTYILAVCVKTLMALSVFCFAINHLGVSGNEYI